MRKFILARIPGIRIIDSLPKDIRPLGTLPYTVMCHEQGIFFEGKDCLLLIKPNSFIVRC